MYELIWYDVRRNRDGIEIFAVFKNKRGKMILYGTTNPPRVYEATKNGEKFISGEEALETIKWAMKKIKEKKVRS